MKVHYSDRELAPREASRESAAGSCRHPGRKRWFFPHPLCRIPPARWQIRYWPSAASLLFVRKNHSSAALILIRQVIKNIVSWRVSLLRCLRANDQHGNPTCHSSIPNAIGWMPDINVLLLVFCKSAIQGERGFLEAVLPARNVSNAKIHRTHSATRFGECSLDGLHQPVTAEWFFRINGCLFQSGAET